MGVYVGAGDVCCRLPADSEEEERRKETPHKEASMETRHVTRRTRGRARGRVVGLVRSLEDVYRITAVEL